MGYSTPLPSARQRLSIPGGRTDLRKLLISLALLPLVACGGGNSAAPTPQIPNVAGSYSGTTALAFPELGQSITCPTTTSVTQSGSTVNFTPLMLGGECDTSFPLEEATIDNTGAIQGESGTEDEECGRYTWVGSGGFSGRNLQLSVTASSTTCPDFNLTINLAR
jgi:hypothetical protein